MWKTSKGCEYFLKALYFFTEDADGPCLPLGEINSTLWLEGLGFHPWLSHTKDLMLLCLLRSIKGLR
jgi:hypothetical protein